MWLLVSRVSDILVLSYLKELSVTSLATELVVIVIGVLVAVAIDSWWQSVQNQETEKELLVSLQSDLSDAESHLQSLIQRDRQIIEAAELLTADGANSIAARKTNELNPLFATVPREVRLRTYDELNETGKLRLISDREIRLLLTDFESQARSLAGYDLQMGTQWNETARPILYRVFSWELFRHMEKPRSAHDELRKTSGLGILEAHNVIIDRGNFATVHMSLSDELLRIVRKLQVLVAKDREAVHGSRTVT